MGLGTSIFLAAVGAIMTFAVQTTSTNGFNIHNAGVILMIIGAIGIVVSLVIWGPRVRTRRTTIEDGAGRRSTVTQRDDGF